MIDFIGQRCICYLTTRDAIADRRRQHIDQ